ncbi:hypothetical protein [Curtobacterium sp. MCJR17_043]|uniref:hypothetical protein n=1 Tax=Curtobacterium sp. MCJR17_043 TaxID=2175660 RepID=UPI0032E8BE0B
MSTAVFLPPTLFVASAPAKLVLNALTTCDSGRRAARSAAPLPASKTTGWKVAKSTVLVMSTTVLPARTLLYLSAISGEGGVRDGEDDDVAGEGGGLVGVLDRLDGSAAVGEDGGDRGAHVAGTEDADAGHDVCSCFRGGAVGEGVVRGRRNRGSR